MKRQKLFRSKSRKTKRRTGDQRRTGLLSFQQLEPRMMLAGDFAPYIDLDVATDWAAIHGTGGYNDRGYDVIVQDDGKMVVTGVIPRTPYQNHQDMLVARYNADGTIDTSFNGSGYNLVDFGTNFRDIGTNVTLQSDGKIVAVGEAYDYSNYPSLADHYLIAARFDSDGTLDATYTFGPGEPGAEPFGDYLWANDVLVHSSGKILILSTVKYTADNWDILLTQLNSDFTLDTSFGDGGIVVHDFITQRNSGNTLIELSDGKILVAGERRYDGGAVVDGYYARFNADGTHDGFEGTIDTSVLGKNSFNNLAVDANDNAYFSGPSDVSADGADSEVVIVKMDSAGNLDSGFGIGGIFRYDMTSGNENGTFAIDPTGKLMVGGTTNGLGAGAAFVIQVNADGTIDKEFGSVFLPPDAGGISGMTFDASNRLVVTGNIVRPSTLNVWLLRVNPNVEMADSFENGQWNGLWDDDGENDWFTSTQRSTEGIYSAEIDGRVTDAMLTVSTPIPIDLSAYGSAELRFDWLIEGGFDGGEYLALDFLNEDGNWDQIAILRGNIDQEDIWHNETVQISDSQYLYNGFQFRYLAKANKSTEDANVDNVVLFGTSLAGLPNQAPTITSSPIISATEDLLYTYDVDASDPDVGDTVTFSLDVAPTGMTVDPNTGVIQWTPNNSHVGLNPVTVLAQDAGGLFDMQSFDVSVTNVNDAPSITNSPVVTATAETLYSYDVEALDPDIGDTLSYFLDASPSGMRIDSVGLIQWTPSTAQTGVQVTVRVQDVGGLFDSQSFAIDVAGVNHAPTITSTPVTSASEDGPYSYDVNATDPDIGDTLAFSLDTAPGGMTIDANSGLIQWTPDNSHVGSNSITVRVADNGGLFVTQSFDVNVTNINDVPTITSVPITSATEDSLYGYDVEAVDPDVGDTLTFSLDSAPTGMTIIALTGLIQWTPTSSQVGDHSITVRVEDVSGSSDSQDFVISVGEATFNDTVVFSDNFENGGLTDQWSQDSQNDWRRVTSKRFDGSYSAEVDGRATDAALISNSIDMSGYGSGDLTFAWLIEKGFDSGEFLALDFKNDLGAWVQNVRILEGNVDQENTWHQETVALDTQYLHDSFQFQYRATVSSSREDAYVDTVELLATSAASRGAIIDPTSQSVALALADSTYVAGWTVDAWNSDTDQRKSDYELRIADLPGNLLGSAVGQSQLQSRNDLIDQRFADVSMTLDELTDEHEIFDSLFDNWDEQQWFGDHLDHFKKR